jgi:ribosome maturation factor RimP
MNRIEKIIWDLAQPVVEQAGLELWDVEYVTEAGQKYLRLYLDGPEGVTLADCEAVSRAFDPILDEKDPVPDSYVFEVSSAGCERQLKRPSDFQRFLGSKVEVKLYSAADGAKQWIGTLVGYEDGDVTIDAGGEHRFTEKQIASVRLHVDF